MKLLHDGPLSAPDDDPKQNEEKKYIPDWLLSLSLLSFRDWL